MMLTCGIIECQYENPVTSEPLSGNMMTGIATPCFGHQRHKSRFCLSKWVRRTMHSMMQDIGKNLCTKTNPHFQLLNLFPLYPHPSIDASSEIAMLEEDNVCLRLDKCQSYLPTQIEGRYDVISFDQNWKRLSCF